MRLYVCKCVYMRGQCVYMRMRLYVCKCHYMRATDVESRSVMMSTYEASYTAFDAMDGSPLKAEFCGMRPFVLISAIFCAASRSIVEAPIEYAKVSHFTGFLTRNNPFSLSRMAS